MDLADMVMATGMGMAMAMDTATAEDMEAAIILKKEKDFSHR